MTKGQFKTDGVVPLRGVVREDSLTSLLDHKGNEIWVKKSGFPGPVNPVDNDWKLSTLGLNVGGEPVSSLFDARTLENGNILYCCGRDTTANSETTGVAEINPITREILWQWHDPAWLSDDGPEAAYKLINGNYLICDVDATGNLGTTDIVYELTPSKAKVWGWHDGCRPNRIKPAWIDGRFVIVIYGAAYGTSDHRVLVLDYETKNIIWSMSGLGVGAGAEQFVNGGDVRKINGVNYLLATLWQAATPVVVLINFDTKTVISRTPTGTLSGFGPLDAQWLSDTVCIIATGNGAGTANGFFQLARPFDAAVIAYSAPISGRTMCCNVDIETAQMTWCQNGPVIYSSNLALMGWSQSSSAVTFTGSSANITYSGADIFAVDDPIVFTNAGGALPTEISAAQTAAGGRLYVKSRNMANNTFQVCQTLPSASATAITPSTAGTGTHTATNNIVPAEGALQRVINRINAVQPVVISGYVFKNSSGSSSASRVHGTLQLGDTPATCGYLEYDFSAGEMYVDNSYNNAAGDIVMRTKVAGTKVDGLRVKGNGWPRLGPTAINVAGLTAASATYIGCRAFVNDASTTLTAGIGTVVVGGGANIVPVFCDGTVWRIG